MSILDTSPDLSWWQWASCRDGEGSLLGVFFADGDDRDKISRAKAICAECAASDLCLDAALARHERYGVWAGVQFGDPAERKRVLRRARLNVTAA